MQTASGLPKKSLEERKVSSEGGRLKASGGKKEGLEAAVSYLSKLRCDSVGADFQSVRKLTNYVCAAPPESRLSVFSNIYK